ncbi:hypothetical protein JHK87_022975 [Glycine soja]|nr:hypothetical protein JHK87_022975 [Glycine soja]
MRLFLLACVLLQSSLLQTPPHMPLGDNAYLVALVLDCTDAVHGGGSRWRLRFRLGRS